MWREAKLEEFTQLRKGVNYTSSDYRSESDGAPFITIKCFVKGGGYQPTGLKYISSGIASSKSDFLEVGDVIFAITDLTRAGDIVGSPLRIPDDFLENQCLVSMDCIKITSDETICDKRYLYHALMLDENRLKMVINSAGSTVLHLDTKKVPDFTIKLPVSLSEQRKIAKILETTDAAIEKTQALIAKYENIKQGMMQDLFTRGVDENGQLRPSYEEAPHLYKETELGWLPIEWQIKNASEVCLAVIDCKNRTPPVLENGHPVIRTPNVRNGRFVYEDLVFTDEASYEIWTARGTPETGDVVITREAPFGETCLIPQMTLKACLGQRMMLYKANPRKIDNQFLCSVIQTAMMQAYLLRLAGGSTVGHIRVGDIRELNIPHPKCVEEQNRISKKIGAIEEKIATEQEHLEKLSKMKFGLMQDLLTGKVRVAKDMEERKEAVA